MLYMTGLSFGEMIWSPRKLANWDLGSRVLGSWQDLWHFSRNFGTVNDRVVREVGISAQYATTEVTHASSFFCQDLDCKQLAGIPAHVC